MERQTIVIQVNDVSKQFDDIKLFDGINLQIEKGEHVTILGPGGCGKTTLIKLILGLETPDSGHIKLMGTDMVSSPERDRQKVLRRVGVAFQQGALFDYMTVEDNLRFAIENMTDMSKNEMESKIDGLLAGVKLGSTRKTFPYELSGGMQRRVGIARALATNPVVTFFDEPTSGLDPVTSTIILNMIADLGAKQKDTTMVVATSTVEIAIRFAKRIIILNEGTVIADGPWEELILKGSEWVRHFLSIRLIGLDINYVRELGLPEEFIKQHW